MIGLIFFVCVTMAVLGFGKAAKDAMVPKCRTCHKARAPEATSCLHCGAR